MESRVLVLDDDPESRASLDRIVRLGGMNTVVATGPFPDLSNLSTFARSEGITHVITDHRLRERRFSGFLGAAAAATLRRLTIAPVLVTAFATQDMDINIRPYLAQIPRVLDRRLNSPAKVFREALEESAREVVYGEISRSRRTCRSVVQVAEITESCGQKQLRLEIRQWRRDTTIGFPVNELPEGIQRVLAPGLFLIAQVNIEAASPNDLFVMDFEPVPPEDPDAV